MILLNGHSLAAKDWFRPEAMSLSLEERKSTATAQMAPEAPEVPVGSWLQDDEEPGQGIVWRARSVETIYNTETRQLQLEHIISTLRDQVMFGEVTPEDIAGEGATDCTAEQAVRYILARQSIWQLGDFEFTDRNPYNFNGDSLFSALEMVSASLDGAIWEYDLGSLPFTLHIRKLPQNATCEMREGRNIQSLRKVIDRSKMYTRFYPIGKDDLHITGDYVSRNENIWGVIERIETDSSRETEEALIRWANEKLSRHAEPIVTITISGFDLSEATGESLDHLTLCRKCRIPLPEYGTTITEKITKLRWADKIKEKEKVTVTLANELDDIATIVQKQINDAASGRGGGGRGGMKEAREDHAWFVDTDTHVAMVAEALIGNGPGGADWSRVAEIIVDGYGIHDRVVATEGEIVLMQAEIEITESHWRAEFDDMTNSLHSEIEATASHLRGEFEDTANSLHSEIEATASHLRTEYEDTANSLRGEIQATAESLNTVYTKTGVNSLGVNETLYSKITQNAESITTKVGKGDIASTINQTAQSVLIQASKINLEGYVTATMLDAVDAKIGNLTSGVTTASLLKTTSLQASSFSFHGDAARWGTLSLGSIKSMTVMCHSVENKDFDHYHSISISESDGVITVEIGAAASSAGSDSFNMADTAFFQDAVSAAINSVAVHAADIIEYQNAVYNSTTHNTTVYIQATASNGKYGRQTFHVSGADAYAAGEAHANSQYTQVSVTPIKATSAIRINETPVTLYEAGSGTKYDRGTGLTARPVVSSGGTIFYEANAQATYRQAGSGTKYDRGTGLTARPVVSSGGTIFYEANAQATYRQAGSGTKYDRGTGLTARPVVSSGGTVFYTAGTAVTMYKGNGGSFTVQGAQVSVTPIQATSAIRLGTKTTIDGKSYYPVVSSGGTIYYKANAATTYYQAGTVTKYARGDSESITPIGSTSVRLGAEATYYPGDGGAFTPQGAEVVVTPIKATSAIRLGASGTYYPGDGGAFTPQGDEVVVTPIKATSAIRLGDAGTYYPGDGGSFTPQGSAQDAYKKLSSGGTIYYQANPAATYYTKDT